MKMKRIVSTLLAGALALSLCACGSANQAEAVQTGTAAPEASTNGSASPQSAVQEKPAIWSLQQTVDEFGDVVADSENIILKTISTGDFSNTATSSNNLKVEIVLTSQKTNIFCVKICPAAH